MLYIRHLCNNDDLSQDFIIKEYLTFTGLDMESRNNKKRCMGRVTKNLADLTLQAGLVTDSLSLYYSSAEILKSVNDWLWLAAANEGPFN